MPQSTRPRCTTRRSFKGRTRVLSHQAGAGVLEGSRPFQFPAYLSNVVARCMAPVLRWGVCRRGSGPLGPWLCKILHTNFREPSF